MHPGVMEIASGQMENVLTEVCSAYAFLDDESSSLSLVFFVVVWTFHQFGFFIQVSYLGSLLGFLIWVPYSGSLSGFLIWIPYLGSLFRFLISGPYSGSSLSLLI